VPVIVIPPPSGDMRTRSLPGRMTSELSRAVRVAKVLPAEGALQRNAEVTKRNFCLHRLPSCAPQLFAPNSDTQAPRPESWPRGLHRSSGRCCGGPTASRPAVRKPQCRPWQSFRGKSSKLPISLATAHLYLSHASRTAIDHGQLDSLITSTVTRIVYDLVSILQSKTLSHRHVSEPARRPTPASPRRPTRAPQAAGAVQHESDSDRHGQILFRASSADGSKRAQDRKSRTGRTATR
jgi:hypothetical protein